MPTLPHNDFTFSEEAYTKNRQWRSQAGYPRVSLLYKELSVGEKKECVKPLNILVKAHLLHEISHFAFYSVQFSSVAQSCPTLCDPWIAARQASVSITNSQSSLRLASVESVMPSSHLLLGGPLLLLPPIPPSIKVFSNEYIHIYRERIN